MAAAAAALAAPAAASATPRISVENGAIRFVGDERADNLRVYGVENGEQWFGVSPFTAIGPGCRDGHPPPTHGPHGTVLCTRDGVDRIEFVGGDNHDYFAAGSGNDDLPVHADMGAGWDQFIGGTEPGDIVSGGPGRDTYSASLGNDTVDLGDGDDVAAGGLGNDTILGGRGNDRLEGADGDDVLDGGPGNDRLIPGAGIDSVNGGAGNDAINSIDGEVDGAITCGDGLDALWTDTIDPVAPDCDLQDDGSVVKLPAPNVLPVAVPCDATGPCSGKLTVYPAPGADRPTVVPPPLRPPKRSKTALVTARFELSASARHTVRPKLGKHAAKRLKKLGGETTLEARITFAQGGKTYMVRRTFGVRRR